MLNKLSVFSIFGKQVDKILCFTQKNDLFRAKIFRLTFKSFKKLDPGCFSCPSI